MCLVRIVIDKVKFVIMMNWEETWEKNDTQPHKKDTNKESNFSGLALVLNNCMLGWINFTWEKSLAYLLSEWK